VAEIKSIGFIGLGVMGEPMCANLAKKGGLPVYACDVRAEPLERLAEAGVEAVASPGALAERTDLIFLSLPGGNEVRAVCTGDDGLLAHGRSGQTVVDTSTSPVGLSRELAGSFADAGIAFADAPVARTRAAAQAGTPSIMVGADPETFARVRPYLDCIAEEVTHCGEVGAGQVVKLMNNMVLFQTVVALAEALTIGRRAGVDGEVLLETLTKGSADSFALRNHGMKALLPGTFPEQAFSTRYALKDLSYALALAEAAEVEPHGALIAKRMLEESLRMGHGDEYFPALIDVVEG
jgi:3-hydroxyisobutyrate dehydrogenase-like beta-hydroxyacid dehydrogenase